MMALLNQFYCKYPTTTTVNKSNTISNRNYLLSSSYMFNLIILIIVCIVTPIINASKFIFLFKLTNNKQSNWLSSPR